MTDHLRVAGCRLEIARITPPHTADAVEANAAPPTLVFLHDGLGSISTWRDFPACVSRETGCPAFVFSRAGYGNSDPVPLPRPLAYMQHEGREVMPDLLDAAAIDDAILIGHSDGGSIALVYAATPHARNRVRGIVLEAPHVFCEARSIESIDRAREEYVDGTLRDRLARHHADPDVAFWGWNRAWLDPDFLEWNIQASLPNVRAPILVIQSSDDPFGTLRQLDAIEGGSGGPVERLVLDDCGHAPHRDRPDATLEAVTSFVRSVLAARTR